jgi:hypothetical protein
VRSILFAAVLIAIFPLQTPSRPPVSQTPDPPAPADPQYASQRNHQPDPVEVEAEKRQLKAWNKARQEAIRKDTDRLYQLATELKQYVDKTNENILSVDVIKKAEEVEKLAKNVKEKMKSSQYPPEQPSLFDPRH